MADKFPSLEDFSAGKSVLAQPFQCLGAISLDNMSLPTLTISSGQTETKGNGAHADDDNILDDDFLTRERAALGDDAAQFSSPGDNYHGSATVEDGDDDLLGGGDDYHGGNVGGEQATEFESSFPALDMNNSVRPTWSYSWSWAFAVKESTNEGNV